MKETPAAFARRTGTAYDPPAALRALARPLRAREACPTLFRFPGPLGLAELLRAGLLERLGPESAPWVWLAPTALGTRSRPARLFGVVALLDPLRLLPCLRRTGQYLGVNRETEDPESLVWVPPSVVRAPLGWDRVRTATEARRRIGPRYEEERAAVGDRLAAYLEELSTLARAGAPGPATAWCEVPERERRRWLAQHGLRPRWTGERWPSI